MTLSVLPLEADMPLAVPPQRRAEIPPLLPLEVRARTHATLCAVGFLILLPFGTLVARYTRTFTKRWFATHAIVQLVIAAPVIFTGWGMGYNLAESLRIPHFQDPHQRMGLSLLILYSVQLILGILIHYVKIPTLGRGRRPLQNYLHVLIGLAILALAASQVHYGLDTEWNLALGGLHLVPASAMKAFIAIVVIFWTLYVVGLVALLRRQFRQERQQRQAMKQGGQGQEFAMAQGQPGTE